MKRIVQIELTNFCNRACFYCGNPIQTRKKGFISFEIIDRCIEVLKNLNQTSVGLNHYGESLLHKNFISIVKKMNDNNIIPWLYTNSDLIDDNMIEKMKALKFESITMSGHRDQNELIEVWTKMNSAGIPNVWWQHPVAPGSVSIANQVPTEFSLDKGLPPLQDPINHCKFLRDEECIVLWDGSLVPCCFDFDGKGIFGNVMDENCLELKSGVFGLCCQCPGHPSNIV